MRKLAVLLFLVIATILPALSARAERFEYITQVDSVIPSLDSTGVHDSIFVPLHIAIQDINFFIGIVSQPEGWADATLIDVYSPSGVPVTLNGWRGPMFGWYDIWYDTDRPEDGPGELEDYAGTDAYGNWEMFCFNPFDAPPAIWNNWHIEIYGELVTGIQGNESEGLIPDDFLLKETYPNPFNSSTMIEYGLPVESHVKIEIYDILGRLCKTLMDSQLPAGYHQVAWNGEDESNQAVASGVYLVKMTAGDRQLTNRAALVK
jgi:hypothetical protein